MIHFALSGEADPEIVRVTASGYIGPEEPRCGRDRQCGEPRFPSAYLRKVGGKTDPTILPPFDGLKRFRLLSGLV